MSSLFPSAWKKEPGETPIVSYWKNEVRRWQRIAALAFLAGLQVGLVAIAIFIGGN